MRELEVAFLDQSVDCRTPATASGSFGPICPPPPAVVPGPGRLNFIFCGNLLSIPSAKEAHVDYGDL